MKTKRPKAKLNEVKTTHNTLGKPSAGLLAALVARWRDAARGIDTMQCGEAELERRDTLYFCAEELEHKLEEISARTEAANAQAQRPGSPDAGSGTVNENSLKDLRRALVAVSKLAAKTPQFWNPIDAWEAELIRDFVLHHEDRFKSPNAPDQRPGDTNQKPL